MLAWVMNMGFAASPSGAPPVTTSQSQFIVIGVGTLIRSVALLFFIGQF